MVSIHKWVGICIGVITMVTKVVKITRYAKKNNNVYCDHPDKAWIHIIA